MRECRVTMPLGRSRSTLTVRVRAASKAVERSQAPDTGSSQVNAP
ncbi:hypothetical protein ACFV8X_26700 [Streptomyces sp. NPDC059868]